MSTSEPGECGVERGHLVPLSAEGTGLGKCPCHIDFVFVGESLRSSQS